jgi:hypothetical protein
MKSVGMGMIASYLGYDIVIPGRNKKDKNQD